MADSSGAPITTHQGREESQPDKVWKRTGILFGLVGKVGKSQVTGTPGANPTHHQTPTEFENAIQMRQEVGFRASSSNAAGVGVGGRVC